MKFKKHTVFLIISLALFLASLIAIIAYYGMMKAEIDAILAVDNDTQLRFGYELSWLISLIFAISFLGVELSFIRSAYKIIKHRPKGWRKIFYIISASIAFIAIVCYCIAELSNISFITPSGRDYTGEVYICTTWLPFIVSFILGSVSVGNTKEDATYLSK